MARWIGSIGSIGSAVESLNVPAAWGYYYLRCYLDFDEAAEIELEV